MSKTISVPIRLPEETGGTQPLPLHTFKDPVRYPEECVYCGAPKSREVSFNAGKWIQQPGEEKTSTYYKVIVPYCDKHAKQSKVFSVLFVIETIVGFVIGISLAYPLLPGMAAMITAATGKEWMGFVGGLLVWLGAGFMAGMILVTLPMMVVGRFVIGLFVPAIKDHNPERGALGLLVRVVEPKEKADLKTYTLDFTFTNEEYAMTFEELNQLSPEEIASAREQLRAAELARAAEAEARAAEAKAVRMEALIRTLRDDRWDRSGARREAAKALGEIGGTRAVEPLIEALKDKEVTVRAIAARSLGEIGDERAVEPLAESLKSRKLQFAFARKAATEALAKIGSDRAIEALLKTLELNESPHVLEAAADAFGQMGDARAVEPLIRLLKDRIELPWLPGVTDVLAKAIRALGEIGDARAIDTLVQGLRHKNRKVRTAAAEALGKIGDARALEPLTKALEDRDKRVREAVEGALERVGAKTT